jgi:hypothetical protein
LDSPRQYLPEGMLPHPSFDWSYRCSSARRFDLVGEDHGHGRAK